MVQQDKGKNSPDQILENPILESQQSVVLNLLVLSADNLCKQFSPRSGQKERSGSVVECLTRDRRVVGSNLTGVTVLWSLSKTHLS